MLAGTVSINRSRFVRTIRKSSRFEKDLERMKKRGADMDRFKEAVRLLSKGERLPRRYRDHKLKGEYEGCRDCHLKHDWVLIYALTGEDELRVIRTGSHADLFE